MKKEMFKLTVKEVKMFGGYCQYVYDNWEDDNWSEICKGDCAEDGEELELVNDIFEDISEAIDKDGHYLCDVDDDYTYDVMTTQERYNIIKDRIQWVETKMDRFDKAMYVR